MAAIPWVPEAKQEQWWLDRHAQHVENTLNNPDSIKVLFYGDSITEGWGGEGRNVFEQYYAPLGAANYGIGGDNTEHVLYRIKEGQLERLNPALCVIKIGTNNIWNHDDIPIAMGIVFNVMELRERLPNMKILVLGVLPRYNEDWTTRTANINNIIRHLDNGNTIRYLDMRDHFYKGGNEFYTELYASDLLHLADPLFREMLGNTND